MGSRSQEKFPRRKRRFNSSKMKILGVDCGDVIFYQISGTLVPGSLEGLRRIVRSRHFDKVYIVSKAGFLSQILFRIRFRRLNFWEYTGIPRENLYFCRRYEDKKAICEKLSVTHFIDDRFRVLHNLESVRHIFAFNPTRAREFRKYPDVARRATIIRSWREMLPLLLRSR